MSDLAYGRNEHPPVELMEAWLCERFHCRPSGLDGEDGHRMLLMADLDNLYQVMSKLARGEKLSADEHKIAARQLREEAGANGSAS